MGYELAGSVIEEVKKAVKGKDDVLRKVMMTILAGGHILMEDIPGVGKTTLALAFSKAMDLKVNRMQFTTDVLPSDVVGFSMYNAKTQEFEYKPGAVLCNLFLADEINRTSSKTQSALLEAMEEGQVTVDGVSHKIPTPFTVIATQNPVGSAGTQLLPESQLDRFMVKLSMGYPDLASEVSILTDRKDTNPIDEVKGVCTAENLLTMKKETAEISVDPAIYEYIAMLAAMTRKHPMLELGISPRGSLAVASLAKANAYLEGRSYLIPEDVTAVWKDVTSHRMLRSTKAKAGRVDLDKINQSLFQTLPMPKHKE